MYLPRKDVAKREYLKGLSEAIILSKQPVVDAMCELLSKHVHPITVRRNKIIDDCEYCRGVKAMGVKIIDLITPEYTKQMMLKCGREIEVRDERD